MNLDFLENIPNDPIFYTKDEGFLFLDKPTKLDVPIEIDKSLIDEKYVKISTPESIKQYFNDITEDYSEMHLNIFNGISITDGAIDYCTYCTSKMEDDDWYYCFHCYKSICKVCYDNKSDIKKEVKNKINECRSFNKIHRRPIYSVIEPHDINCDCCHKNINYTIERYSGYKKPYSAVKKPYLDVCMDCYNNKEEIKNYVNENNMKLIKINDRNNYLFNYTDFNSLCYWVPIIEDHYWCRILMNLNPQDKNYGKLCIQGSDHNGGSGCFIIYDDSITLEVLLQKLKKITDRGVIEYLDKEWDGPLSYKDVIKIVEIGSHDYTGPIFILMEQLNMPIYYS